MIRPQHRSQLSSFKTPDISTENLEGFRWIYCGAGELRACCMGGGAVLFTLDLSSFSTVRCCCREQREWAKERMSNIPAIKAPHEQYFSVCQIQSIRDNSTNGLLWVNKPGFRQGDVAERQYTNISKEYFNVNISCSGLTDAGCNWLSKTNAAF